ncbi:hypothetical protein KW785_02720 [Candidatus Parcubacteria bacterium]|nr:hypothetical protein [Candidatus Parcubacteria bacterium]
MHDLSNKLGGTAYIPVPNFADRGNYDEPEGKKQFVENFSLLLENELHLRSTLDLGKIKSDLAVCANCSLVVIEGIIARREAPTRLQARRIARYFRVTLGLATSKDLKRHLDRHFVTPRPLSGK